MRERRAGTFLFALCFCLYWPTSYGGVRSPDCEVVFRTAESLALRGTFAIQPLEDWPKFGTAAGADGRRYSKFGPLPSLALVPGVWLGTALEAAGWPGGLGDRLPLSHYAGGGLRHLLNGTRPADPRPHALRFAAAWTNPLLAALGVLVFWRLARRLSRDPLDAFLAALLYAFATPLWAYAGTFFSEPLAILFILLALDRLMSLDPSAIGSLGPVRLGPPLAAGLLAGAACGAHITAALFLPVFLAYACLAGKAGQGRWSGGCRAGAAFGAGAAAVLVVLGGFNWARFGNPFVGGRTTTAEHFFPPWTAEFWGHLYGLLAGGGKGWLWYAPILAAAILGWGAFRRRHRLLADTVAASVLLRLVFIAAYKDWHGGICLGPRYLLLLVPLLLLAVPAWVEAGEGARRRAGLALFGAACVVQQAFFVLGEPFTYYHRLKAAFLAQGIMPTDTQVFTAWRWSPVLHLLDGLRGPWALLGAPGGPFMVWGGLAGLTLGALWVCRRAVFSNK